MVVSQTTALPLGIASFFLKVNIVQKGSSHGEGINLVPASSCHDALMRAQPWETTTPCAQTRACSIFTAYRSERGHIEDNSDTETEGEMITAPLSRW